MKDWSGRIIGALIAALVGAVATLAAVKPNADYSQDKKMIFYILSETNKELEKINLKLDEVIDRLPQE